MTDYSLNRRILETDIQLAKKVVELERHIEIRQCADRATDYMIETLKESYEKRIADLKAEIERLKDKEQKRFDEMLKKHEDREKAVAESTQTLYCHWEDTSSYSVPAGIDLRDTKNVCWYVRYGTLYIETRDGKTFELEATDEPQLKCPEWCDVYDEEDGTEERIEFNNGFDSESESSESEEDETDSHTSDQEH